MHEGKVFAVERDGTATQASASSKKQRCEKRPTLAFVCNNHRGNILNTTCVSMLETVMASAKLNSKLEPIYCEHLGWHVQPLTAKPQWCENLPFFMAFFIAFLMVFFMTFLPGLPFFTVFFMVFFTAFLLDSDFIFFSRAASLLS